MFGFLKKKLSDGIEKIKSIVKKEEIPVEEIAQQIKKEEAVEKIEKEIEYKRDLIKDAGYDITPAIEETIEQPYKKLLEEIPETKEEKLEIKEPEIPEVKPETKEELKKVEPKPEKPKKEGFLKKIKRAVVEKTISEDEIKDVLWELQLGLIESDVAVSVAEKIVADLKTALVGQSVKRGQIEALVRNSLKNSIKGILDVDGFDFMARVREKKPFLIVFLGFNGSGKTTTIARIGYMLKEHGLSCVFAAADTWRAAAIEQIQTHGDKLGIPVIKQKYGADPAAVIFDAVKYANAHSVDVVLADTAGRSHVNLNLMDELKKIVRVNKPDLKILVLDALTGNDIYDQSKLFDGAVGVNGLILTKADVYDKGGAALSAAHTIGKPLLFLGVGQDYSDLKPFDADEIVKSLLE